MFNEKFRPCPRIVVVGSDRKLSKVCLISFLFERTFDPFLCFSGFTTNDIVQDVRGDRLHF